MRTALPSLALTVTLLGACQADEPAELRVISYNVKGTDWTPDDRERWPEAVALDDLVTTLRAHPADVIGLQEVRAPDRGASLAEELAEALGEDYRALVATTTSVWLPYVQQNAIVARHELLDAAELDLGEDPGGREHRRFQYARIELPGGETVHLGNVHLFTDDALQRGALEAISAFVSQRVAPGEHFVWTGDLNLEPLGASGSPYEYLVSDFAPPLVDPVVALGQDAGAKSQQTSPAEAPAKRIDYVLTSPTMTPIDHAPILAPLPSRTYPDHLAVDARFRLGTD